MRRWLLPTMLLVLTGCHAVNFGGAKPATLAVTQAVRSVQIEVRGPQSLGAGGGILSDAGAGLWSGGAILSDAGAGLVTAGGGNYRVLEAASSFVPVSRAGLQLLKLDGSPVGTPLETDSKGDVTLPNVPDGQPLSAVAAFETGGKVYRLAVLLAPGAAPSPVYADPINTMVESAVTNILAAHPLAESPALTFTKLKQVWTICNQANITVAPADLQANLPPDQLRANLVKIWQQAIASQITSPTDKQTVQDFMNQIRAAAGSK